MTIAFDLNKLSGIYIETMKSPEKAVAFDFKYANGKFLFMIFLSDEDEKSKDKLFVYMRNTRRLLELKMYGNHFKDKFLIYFKDRDQQAFLDELNLNVNDGNSFKFKDFLECLNANIPKTISRKERKHNLRDNCKIINRISDDEKTAGKYMIKRVYKEESDKRKTIDKIADACIIEEVLYAGKRHLYLVSAIDGKVCWHFFWL